MTPILSSTLLRTQSDARLLALARQGYERPFEAIVERYRKPLHRYVRRMLPDARAEDVVQQAFLSAWSSLQAGAEVKDLKSWLYRVSHNAAIDALRKNGYDHDELSESLQGRAAPESDFERRTALRQTLSALAGLPDRQREALLRTAVEGESRAAVAADLGLTDGAVRQLVHRARATVRAAATAVTPPPVATWAATFGGRVNSPVGERIAEAAAGAGSAGVAGVLVKAGAVAVTAGVIAAGPASIVQHAVQHGGAAAADAAQAGMARANAHGADNGHGQGQGPGAGRGHGHGAAHAGGHGHGEHGNHGRHGDGHRAVDNRSPGERSAGSGASGSHDGTSGGGSHDGSSTSSPTTNDDHGGTTTTTSSDHGGTTTTTTTTTTGDGSSSGSGSSGTSDGGMTTQTTTTSSSGDGSSGSTTTMSSGSGEHSSGSTTTTTPR